MIDEVIGKASVLTRAVANLDDTKLFKKYPDRRIEATKPRCILPRSLFDESRWTPLCAGRWRDPDHITLGEARGVLKVLDSVVLSPKGFRTVIVSLQDNQAVAGSMHKGRSPSPSLNYLLRRKASRTLAFAIRLILPWVETTLMPADWLSRLRQVPGHLRGRRQ